MFNRWCNELPSEHLLSELRKRKRKKQFTKKLWPNDFMKEKPFCSVKTHCIEHAGTSAHPFGHICIHTCRSRSLTATTINFFSCLLKHQKHVWNKSAPAAQTCRPGTFLPQALPVNIYHSCVCLNATCMCDTRENTHLSSHICVAATGSWVFSCACESVMGERD